MAIAEDDINRAIAQTKSAMCDMSTTSGTRIAAMRRLPALTALFTKRREWKNIASIEAWLESDEGKQIGCIPMPPAPPRRLCRLVPVGILG